MCAWVVGFIHALTLSASGSCVEEVNERIRKRLKTRKSLTSVTLSLCPVCLELGEVYNLLRAGILTELT